ncbi:helix-turn-helix domain-containing protein [Chitinophagaceae bacterium 26-R-25]|nr:helix-turn-helix domain-containing protein [Chitinophagaceae bacterium 26-R-25]
MKENVNNGNPVTPMLFPYQPTEFWQSLRQVIREEVLKVERERAAIPTFETSGMTYKPLYKIAEVCELFHITKPTVYDWVKHGKLKPFKVRSRVFFLWQDIQQLFQSKEVGQ